MAVWQLAIGIPLPEKIKVGISELDGSLPSQGLRPWRPLGSLKWIL
jgi:hypothetical protein